MNYNNNYIHNIEISKTAFKIMFVLLISKCLGFLKEMLIASKFGMGYETDVYFIGITACAVITAMIGTALDASLIPTFAEIKKKKGESYELVYINNILNIITLLIIIFSSFGILFAPIIVKILAYGFSGAQYKLAVSITRIGYPMAIFIIYSTIISIYLKSNENFIVPSLVGIPNNIVLLIFLYFFSKPYGITGLMVATLIAFFTQIIIQMPEFLRQGYKFKLFLDINDKYVKKILPLAIPVLLGTAVRQINIIIDRTLASTLSIGSISALHYANRINLLILTVIVLPIVTVFFTKFSKESCYKKIDNLFESIIFATNLITLIIIPISIFILLFSPLITTVLFERGKFVSYNTVMTSTALKYYSIGLLGFGISELFNRAFYSLHDTKTPLRCGLIAITVNIIFNFILIKYMQHNGLALATSISGIVLAILLIFYFKKVSRFDMKNIISNLYKVIFSSAVMGIIVYMLYLFFLKNNAYILYNWLSLLILLIVSSVVYLAMCNILRVEQCCFLTSKILKWMKIK